MSPYEIEVAVMDGNDLVQNWVCTKTILPDCTAGVIWRGSSFPLLPGNRIDIRVAHAAPPPTNRMALRAMEDASWVLLQGSAGDLQAALKRLQQAGIMVRRSGRWLGEPAGDIAYDWYLACEGVLTESYVAGLLGTAPQPQVDAPDVRIAVLEQRLADIAAELADLSAALRRAVRVSMAEPKIVQVPEPKTGQDAALLDALAQLHALQARIVEQRPAPSANRRLIDELGEVLAALLPGVDLLRDSLLQATGAFHSRAGFYRALHELPASGARPEGWKRLHSAPWWERHVSNGRDDTGRAYARFNTQTRRWALLLSWKGEQALDIAWLKRQG